jgi:c-di-GMP-binding flagellar brake protein YcgR
MKGMNRRENPRIDVRLKCHMAASGAPGNSFVGETQNISRSGILMLWQGRNGCAPPQTGDLLTLDIELPAHHDFSRKCIHCQGTVVRVTAADGDTARVALSVNYMKFREYQRKVDALPEMEAQIGGWNR